MLDVVSTNLFIAAVHLSVPLVFAAIGGLLSERAGVINIALEGQMLAAAFAGVAVTWWVDDRVVGLLGAAAVGASLGLVHAWFSVTLRANQIVAATAINLLAVGVTAALIRPIWGHPGASETVGTFATVDVPVLGWIPGPLGDFFSGLSILDWVGLALAPVVWVVLFRTPLGLALRACGEQPRAAASTGIDVLRTRYLAVTMSGMLAGLGGAYLALVQVGVFQRGMTQGRGFLALAAMIFGGWRPLPVLGACALFGFADAFQFRAQAEGVDLPHELMLALPYIVALAALATFAGRAGRVPAAVGKPYAEE